MLNFADDREIKRLMRKWKIALVANNHLVIEDNTYNISEKQHNDLNIRRLFSNVKKQYNNKGYEQRKLRISEIFKK
jgi:hypothetical protein